MTTLTPFQDQAAEAIWTQTEEAQATKGSLLAAMETRIGGLADFFQRYFERNTDVQSVINALIEITDTLGWDIEAMADEAEKINAYETIDSDVKAAGGSADDADAVQIMIVEQNWLALTTEVRHLGKVNEMDNIVALATRLEEANASLLEVLYN